jgi:hypothetical protein
MSMKAAKKFNLSKSPPASTNAHLLSYIMQELSKTLLALTVAALALQRVSPRVFPKHSSPRRAAYSHAWHAKRSVIWSRLQSASSTAALLPSTRTNKPKDLHRCLKKPQAFG